MPFQKGQSGNKDGQKYNRDWREAIRMALADKDGSDWKKALRNIATTLIEAAQQGDMAAIKEIGDRLDGKPQQSVDMNVTATPEARVYPLNDQQETHQTIN